MKKKSISTNSDNAKRMAHALAKAGLQGKLPEPDPNPHDVAKEAYLMQYPSRQLSEFLALRRDAMKGIIPRAAYYRKLAQTCRAALRRGVVPADKIVAVAFTWGYFESKLDRPANDSD